MTNWKNISKNPFCPEVLNYLKNELKARRAGRCYDLMDFIKSFVKGYTVLDIGVVDHEINRVRLDQWKHGHISKWAKSAVGVDILSEEIDAIRKMGFNVIEVDATSEANLGIEFERIVIADVIEHVDNPVNLLRFAARHLKTHGLILVSTPNPYYMHYIWRVYRDGTTLANAEHISWISPCMAIELGRRSGLSLKEYWLLQAPVDSNRNYKINSLLKRLFYILLGDTELMTHKFIYLFEKK
jgi:2-polyprenyl-3-methyl-5-hydroxy-6-metoxy-1,4-benzoquinol methylase